MVLFYYVKDVHLNMSALPLILYLFIDFEIMSLSTSNCRRKLFNFCDNLTLSGSSECNTGEEGKSGRGAKGRRKYHERSRREEEEIAGKVVE